MYDLNGYSKFVIYQGTGWHRHKVLSSPDLSYLVEVDILAQNWEFIDVGWDKESSKGFMVNKFEDETICYLDCLPDDRG